MRWSIETVLVVAGSGTHFSTTISASIRRSKGRAADDTAGFGRRVRLGKV
jgi:hypothetical protein